MNKFGLSVLISLLLTGGVLGVALLLPKGTVERKHAGEIAPRDVPAPNVEGAIAALSARIDLLTEVLQAAPRQERNLEPAVTGVGVESILERLLAIEKKLDRTRNTDDELAAARVRAERESRLQAEDGYIAADELFSENRSASGYSMTVPLSCWTTSSRRI